MLTRIQRLATLGAAGLLLQAGVALGQAGGRPAATWDLVLERDEQAPSTVTVANRCSSLHRFAMTKSPGMEWLTFVDPTEVEVAAGGNETLAVRIDTAGLEPSLYEGEVTVTCLTCRSEPLCRQDRDRFAARLRVPWRDADLEELDDDELIATEVLVLLSDLAGPLIRRLEQTYGLREIRRFELPAYTRAAVLFAVPAPPQSLLPVLGQLFGEPQVLWAQPNFVYQTLDERYDDPYAQLQDSARSLRAAEAHSHATGRGVRVAVLDTGVDFRHRDLARRVTHKVSFVAAEKGGKRGKVEKKITADVHGTAMAGLIAAVADNGLGIYGIAPEAEILAVKVCSARAEGGGRCTSESMARGLDYAILEGARVVNVSLGGPRDPLFGLLVEEASSRGIALVGASGNEGPGARVTYPAAFEEVIAVSAIDGSGELWSQASRGELIDCVAPGVEVVATTPGNRFHPITGTSVAAAHVSGLLALVLERRPSLSATGVRRLLAAAAHDLGSPGKDESFGYGVVDACRLLEEALEERGLCP